MPTAAQKVVAFIDVQQRLLYYVVTAFGEGMTGWILDYGTFPKQSRRRFLASSASVTLERQYGGALEQYIRAGVHDLTTQLIEKQWAQDDGTFARIERIGIDANWAKSTEVIKNYIRTAPNGALLIPCHGRGIKGDRSPISSWKKETGQWRGLESVIPRGRGREVRHLIYDTNFYKSLFMRRISTENGTTGAISLFGTAKERHDFFAEQLTAEKPSTPEGYERRVEVWSNEGNKENHWFDCAVGCCAIANTLGISPPGITGKEPKKRKRISLSELKRRAS